MLVIGLTGGIGSGKSTVADVFATLEVPIIDADKIARQLTETDQPAFQAIVRHFGSDILLSNGTLDRKKMRERVFNQPTEKAWLENLLHPLIRQVITKEIAKLSAPYCVVVIPLLFETGPYPFLSRILVVDISPDLQIERVRKRDQLTAEQVEKMLQSQVCREERLAGADEVIGNEGDLARLEREVEKMHRYYLGLAKG